MSRSEDSRLREIEAAQRELKHSIEQSRALARKTQELLEQHRRAAARE